MSYFWKRNDFGTRRFFLWGVPLPLRFTPAVQLARAGARSPPQPVHVTHGDRLHQDDEQQGQRGCVVIEDVKPVVPGLHGEHHADATADEAHETWGHRTTGSPA